MLTVLAIVLFLFAQAHSMGYTPAGRLLRGAAIGLLVVSLAMGAFANLGDDVVAKARKQTSCIGDRKLTSVADVVELGAEKYALGVAAFDRGQTSAPGSPERSEADAEALPNLKCANLLLPDFIPAYQRYEQALLFIGSPQRDEGWMSLSNLTTVKDVYENTLKELRAASRAGLLRSSGKLSDFAFSTTRYALVEGNKEALKDARIAADALAGRTNDWDVFFQRWQRPELFTDDAVTTSGPAWFNIGLLDLASGEEDRVRGASRLYDQALAADRDVPETLAASALVDLEMLRSYCGNLHKTGSTCSQIETTIDAIRGRIANIGASTALPVDSPAAANGFAINVTPYSVEWRADVDAFDPQRDRLAVVWYHDRSAEQPGGDGGGWHVRRPLQGLMESYRPAGAPLPAEGADGAAGHITHVPLKAGYCLGGGRYVAELFLNGVLAGSAAVDLSTADFLVVRSRELDLIGCAPSSWVRFGGKGQEWRADVPARTFVLESDGRSRFATVIATFYAPTGMAEDDRRDYFLRRTIKLLLKKDQATTQWKSGRRGSTAQ